MMKVEEFLKSYRADTATAVESLCHEAIGYLTETKARLVELVEYSESEILRIHRALSKKVDLIDLALNTADNLPTATTLNMAIAEFMSQRDIVHILLKAVEKERSGKREWWKAA